MATNNPHNSGDVVVNIDDSVAQGDPENPLGLFDPRLEAELGLQSSREKLKNLTTPDGWAEFMKVVTDVRSAVSGTLRSWANQIGIL